MFFDLIIDDKFLILPTGLITDMSKESAVTRHQAVTTTLERGNDLEKRQEVFEEMSKLLARK